MKIKPHDTERILSRPPEDIRAFLIYGPDGGHVRLSAEKLCRALLGDSNDPFNLRTLTAEQCAADSANLTKEAGNLSLGGGRVVVRVSQAGERSVGAVAHLLAAENVGGVAVVDAGALTPRSALRRLAEQEKKMAAIACYADRPQELTDLVRRRLKQAGLQIAPDALGFFVGRLGADRAISESEIEKLILYKGEEKNINLQDVLASTGDMAAIGLDDLVDCVGLGDVKGLIRSFDRLVATGLSPIVMLNSLRNHFQKILLVEVQTMNGSTLANAIQTIAPPIHFTRKDKFSRQCKIWNREDINAVFSILWKTNIALRQNMPATTSPQALISIASRAERLLRQ